MQPQQHPMEQFTLMHPSMLLPPRIPTWGDFEIQYHDFDGMGWEIDHVRQAVIYTGTITIYFRIPGLPLASFSEDFRICQRLQF